MEVDDSAMMLWVVEGWESGCVEEGSTVFFHLT